MGLWYVGVDMCLISCGRPLSVVGGKLIWMPWLGKIPAASISDGVGDRRGVSASVRSSAMAVERATSQHWEASRVQEKQSEAERSTDRTICDIVGPVAVQATAILSALRWRRAVVRLPSERLRRGRWKLDSNQTPAANHAVQANDTLCSPSTYGTTAQLHSRKEARHAIEIVVLILVEALGLAEPLSFCSTTVKACV